MIQKYFSPSRLAVACVVCAALWFLLIYPLFILAAPEKLPAQLAPLTFPDLPVDAPQWYLGASTVLAGDWKNLYPELNTDVFGRPNTFRPLIETALFDPVSASTNPAFEPIFAIRTPLFLQNFYQIPWLSRYPAEFWGNQHPRMQNSCFNYFYPPPTALVMAPLALLSLENMTLKLWPIAASVAMFGLVVFSGKIFRHVAGKATYAECLLMAVLLFTPWADEFNCGNVSPLLAFCLAWGVWAWLRAGAIGTGTALILPLLTKGLPLFWLPVFFLERRIRWKPIFVLAVWTLLLNAAVFAVAGWSDALYVYRYFFSTLLPRFSSVVGYDYITRIAGYYGIYPGWFYSFLQYLLLTALYYGFWRGCRKADEKEPEQEQNLRLLAVLGGTMCVFLFFTRLHWHHYFPFLFYLPFLAWIFLEMRSGRKTAYAALLLGLPALFTTRLDGGGWNILEEILGAPLLALEPDIATWQYFLPRIRTLAILAGLLLAFLRLYPVVTAKKRDLRIPLAALGIFCVAYFGTGFAIRQYAIHLAGTPETMPRAARLGNLGAIRETAIACESSDPENAAVYFRRAAIRGDAESSYRLGKLYEAGRGVPRDEAIAWRSYLQAAFGGKNEAWPEALRLFPHLEGLTRR